MGRLTFLAACIGGVPIFTFLVVVWLTGGAPLTPFGPAPAATPIIETPVVQQSGPLSAITLARPEIAASGVAIGPEPTTFGVLQ